MTPSRINPVQRLKMSAIKISLLHLHRLPRVVLLVLFGAHAIRIDCMHGSTRPEQFLLIINCTRTKMHDDASRVYGSLLTTIDVLQAHQAMAKDQSWALPHLSLRNSSTQLRLFTVSDLGSRPSHEASTAGMRNEKDEFTLDRSLVSQGNRHGIQVEIK